MRVKWVIKKSVFAIIILVCIFVALLYYLNQSQQVLFLRKMKDACILPMNCLKHLPPHGALVTLNKIMDSIKTIPAVAHYAALGGLNVVTFATKSNSGTVFSQLKPWDERTDKSDQIQVYCDTAKKICRYKRSECCCNSAAGHSGSWPNRRFYF